MKNDKLKELADWLGEQIEKLKAVKYEKPELSHRTEITENGKLVFKLNNWTNSKIELDGITEDESDLFWVNW